MTLSELALNGGWRCATFPRFPFQLCVFSRAKRTSSLEEAGKNDPTGASANLAFLSDDFAFTVIVAGSSLTAGVPPFSIR